MKFSTLGLIAMMCTTATVSLAGDPGTVRVTGDATIEVAPDQAVIDVAVVTEDEDADRAARDNAEKVDAVLSALKGVLGSDAEKRLRTQSIALTPKYTAYQEGKAPRIVGYTAAQVLRVESDDLESVGKLVDAALGAGANRIDGLRFELSDDEPVRARALREATLRARSRAAAIAEALGVEIERVVSVEQGSSSGPVPIRAESYMMQARAASPPTQVLPGAIEVRESVTYTVEIGD